MIIKIRKTQSSFLHLIYCYGFMVVYLVSNEIDYMIHSIPIVLGAIQIHYTRIDETMIITNIFTPERVKD